MEMLTKNKTGNKATQLNKENSFAFVLKFKNANYTVTAEPIIVINETDANYKARYLVDILDGQGQEYSMVFKLNNATGAWVSYFKNELHQSVITGVSDAIGNLTM